MDNDSTIYKKFIMSEHIKDLKLIYDLKDFKIEKCDEQTIAIYFNEKLFCHIIHTKNILNSWFCNIYNDDRYFVSGSDECFTPYLALLNAMEKWKQNHSSFLHALSSLS